MEQRVPQQGLFSAAFINPTEEWNMKERLLITTAIGLMLGTGAFAQSPSDKSKTDPLPAAQSQTNQNSSTSPAPSSTSPQYGTVCPERAVDLFR
jgi:hypothetical protein